MNHTNTLENLTLQRAILIELDNPDRDLPLSSNCLKGYSEPNQQRLVAENMRQLIDKDMIEVLKDIVANDGTHGCVIAKRILPKGYEFLESCS